jgi:hypothetical protein
MDLLVRIGFFKDGRMTLGACLSLAFTATVIGLLAMLVVPVTPPDAAFSARTQAWRALGTAPHGAPNE